MSSSALFICIVRSIHTPPFQSVCSVLQPFGPVNIRIHHKLRFIALSGIAVVRAVCAYSFKIERARRRAYIRIEPQIAYPKRERAEQPPADEAEIDDEEIHLPAVHDAHP